jgi:WD40 repeat protein
MAGGLMTDAFISYSRLDSHFAHRLHEHLQTQRNPMQPQKTLDLWIDRHDIEFSTDWWQRICKGIDEAANVIVILSNNYLASEVCNEEFAYAQQMGKPVIPVLVGDLSVDAFQALRQQRIIERKDWKRNPVHLAEETFEKISKINFISIIDLVFDETVKQIVNSIFQDISYKDGLREISNSASKWMSKKQRNSYLLTGGELEDAERWQSAANAKQLPVETTLSDYIQRSRQAQIQRKRRNLALAMIVPIGIAILGFFLYRAISNLGTEQAIRESQEMAEQSRSILEEQSDLGMLLALQAYEIYPSYEARSNLYTAAYFNPYLRTYAKPMSARAENIAISPDNRLIAVAYPQEMKIGFVDAQTGEVAGQLLDTSSEFIGSYTLAFDEDGESLLVAGIYGEIARYDVATGQLIEILVEADYGSGGMIDGQFSSDGDYLVSSRLDVPSNQQLILLTNVRTGRHEEVNDLDSDLTSSADVAISPDQRYMSVALGGAMVLYDIEREDADFIAEDEGYYREGSFSADSRYLAFVYIEDDATRSNYLIWDIEEGELLNRWADDRSAQKLLIDADGETLYVIYGIGDFAAYNIETGTRQYLQLGAHSSFPTSIAMSPDGRFLVTGAETGEIIIWNSQSVPAMSQAYPFRRGTYAAFLNENEILLSDNSDLAIWNPQQNSLVPLESEVEVSWLSQRGEAIWTYDNEIGEIMLWDRQTSPPSITARISAPNLHIQSIDISSDGRSLVGIDVEAKMFLWDIASQRELSRIDVLVDVDYPQLRELFRSGTVHFQARFLDNASLVVSLPDRLLSYSIRENGFVVQSSFRMPSDFANALISPLAISFDRQSVAAGSMTGDELLIWHPDGNYQILESQALGISANSLAFHPSLPLLATGSWGGALEFWDTELSLPLGDAIQSSDERLRALHFSADGQYLLSSADRGVRLFPADVPALQESICKRINRNFSIEEWRQYFGTETHAILCPQALFAEADSLAFLGERSAAEERFRLLLDASEGNAALSDTTCFYGSLHGFAELVKPACEAVEVSYSSPATIEDRIAAHENYESPYPALSNFRLSSFLPRENSFEESIEASGESLSEDEWSNWARELEIPINNFILSSDTFRDTPYQMRRASLIETTTGAGLEVEIHSPNGLVWYQLQLAPFTSLDDWLVPARITKVEGIDVAVHQDEYLALLHIMEQDLLIRLRAEETVPASDMEAIMGRIMLYTPDPATGNMRRFEFESRLETFDLDFDPHISTDLFEGTGFVLDAIAYLPSELFGVSRDQFAPNAEQFLFLRYSRGKAEPFVGIYLSEGGFEDTAELYEEDDFRRNVLSVGLGEIIEIAGLEIGKEEDPDGDFVYYYFVREGISYVLGTDIVPDEGFTTEAFEELIRRLIEAP